MANTEDSVSARFRRWFSETPLRFGDREQLARLREWRRELDAAEEKERARAGAAVFMTKYRVHYVYRETSFEIVWAASAQAAREKVKEQLVDLEDFEIVEVEADGRFPNFIGS